MLHRFLWPIIVSNCRTQGQNLGFTQWFCTLHSVNSRAFLALCLLCSLACCQQSRPSHFLKSKENKLLLNKEDFSIGNGIHLRLPHETRSQDISSAKGKIADLFSHLRRVFSLHDPAFSRLHDFLRAKNHDYKRSGKNIISLSHHSNSQHFSNRNSAPVSRSSGHTKVTNPVPIQAPSPQVVSPMPIQQAPIPIAFEPPAPEIVQTTPVQNQEMLEPSSDDRHLLFRPHPNTDADIMGRDLTVVMFTISILVLTLAILCIVRFANVAGAAREGKLVLEPRTEFSRRKKHPPASRSPGDIQLEPGGSGSTVYSLVEESVLGTASLLLDIDFSGDMVNFDVFIAFYDSNNAAHARRASESDGGTESSDPSGILSTSVALQLQGRLEEMGLTVILCPLTSSTGEPSASASAEERADEHAAAVLREQRVLRSRLFVAVVDAPWARSRAGARLLALAIAANRRWSSPSVFVAYRDGLLSPFCTSGDAEAILTAVGKARPVELCVDGFRLGPGNSAPFGMAWAGRVVSTSTLPSGEAGLAELWAQLLPHVPAPRKWLGGPAEDAPSAAELAQAMVEAGAAELEGVLAAQLAASAAAVEARGRRSGGSGAPALSPRGGSMAPSFTRPPIQFDRFS